MSDIDDDSPGKSSFKKKYGNTEAPFQPIPKKMIALKGGYMIDVDDIRKVSCDEEYDYDGEPPRLRYVVIINNKDKVYYESEEYRNKQFVDLQSRMQMADVEIHGDSNFNEEENGTEEIKKQEETGKSPEEEPTGNGSGRGTRKGKREVRRPRKRT